MWGCKAAGRHAEVAAMFIAQQFAIPHNIVAYTILIRSVNEIEVKYKSASVNGLFHQDSLAGAAYAIQIKTMLRTYYPNFQVKD